MINVSSDFLKKKCDFNFIFCVVLKLCLKAYMLLSTTLKQHEKLKSHIEIIYVNQFKAIATEKLVFTKKKTDEMPFPM